MSPKSWISVFGAVGVLVAFASIVLQPSTRSFGFVVVSEQLQPVTPPCVALAVTSTGETVLMPVKETLLIRPCTTDPEKVAVRTVLLGSPEGAGAETIAWRMLLLVAFACTSTVQVSPPPATDVSVRVEFVQSTNTNTRDPAVAAAVVVRVMVVLARLSVFVPRFLSRAIAPAAAPVPLSGMLCGLPGASSLIVTAAERAPVADGVNVTETVQGAFAASRDGGAGQVFVWAKSPAFVPPTRIEPMASGAVPLFVTVTVWAALVVPTVWPPKVRFVGAGVTAGCVPVPLRPAVCGLPVALSVTFTLALRLPVADGVKVTEIVQLPPAASVDGEVGHVLVWA